MDSVMVNLVLVGLHDGLSRMADGNFPSFGATGEQAKAFDDCMQPVLVGRPR